VGIGILSEILELMAETTLAKKLNSSYCFYGFSFNETRLRNDIENYNPNLAVTELKQQEKTQF
jgi:hypothetical protein